MHIPSIYTYYPQTTTMSVADIITGLKYKTVVRLTAEEKKQIYEEIEMVRDEKEGWQNTQFGLWVEIYCDLLRQVCNAGFGDLDVYYMEYCEVGLKRFHENYRASAVTPEAFDKEIYTYDLLALTGFCSDEERAAE
jgi:hypothetical protein